MRKVITSTYISLDGVMENPQDWSLDYFNEQAMAYATDQLNAADALLMGRRTYEVFAAAWPERSGDEFSDRMNSMAKFVASTTLESADWNNTTVLGGDLVEEIATLKQQPGTDILMYGFGPVGHTLLRHDLLDELRFWVHPIFAGSGTPADLLFRETAQRKLTLVDTTTFANGVVILCFQPAGKDDS